MSLISFLTSPHLCNISHWQYLHCFGRVEFVLCTCGSCNTIIVERLSVMLFSHTTSYKKSFHFSKPTVFGTVSFRCVCPKVGGRIQELVKRHSNPMRRPDSTRGRTGDQSAIKQSICGFVTANRSSSHLHLANCLFGEIIGPRYARIVKKGSVAIPLFTQTNE